MVYLSDMSRCRPDSALAEKLEKGRWMLIPYETDEVSGTMIVAQSFIKAPDVTLPLGVSGWHAIYIGYRHRQDRRITGTESLCRLYQACALEF